MNVFQRKIKAQKQNDSNQTLESMDELHPATLSRIQHIWMPKDP